MKKWMLIGLLFLPLLACEREWEPEVVAEEADPQGEVTVTFTVPADQIPTKALGEDPSLETMHLAIFGSSGYLKQYVPATLLATAFPNAPIQEIFARKGIPADVRADALSTDAYISLATEIMKYTQGA